MEKASIHSFGEKECMYVCMLLKDLQVTIAISSGTVTYS